MTRHRRRGGPACEPRQGPRPAQLPAARVWGGGRRSVDDTADEVGSLFGRNVAVGAGCRAAARQSVPGSHVARPVTREGGEPEVFGEELFVMAARAVRTLISNRWRTSKTVWWSLRRSCGWHRSGRQGSARAGRGRCRGRSRRGLDERVGAGQVGLAGAEGGLVPADECVGIGAEQVARGRGEGRRGRGALARRRGFVPSPVTAPPRL